MRRGTGYLKLVGGIAVAVVTVSAVLLEAESPEHLDREDEAVVKNPQVVPIEVGDSERKSEPSKPEESLLMRDAIADLAPESFRQDTGIMDTGFGNAFGHGGNGPAVGSATGLGGGTGTMIREASSVDRPAKVTHRNPLDYPPHAKSRGITGHVVLKIRVGVSGQLEETRIIESSPPGVFEEAALRAVRSWRFDSALVAGKAQTAWLTQRIRFDLN